MRGAVRECAKRDRRPRRWAAPWNGRPPRQGRVNPWLRYHRAATAAAAAAVLMLTFGLLLICAHFEPAVPPQVAAPGGGPSPGYGNGAMETDVAVSVDRGPGHRHGDGSGRESDGENPFVVLERNPISTFPLTADTAAYRDVRRALLLEKRLPAPDSCASPDWSTPSPIPIRYRKMATPCLSPSTSPNVRGTRPTIWPASGCARPDAAVEGAAVRVAFNPRRVAAYRLIGYEGRGSAKPAATPSGRGGRSRRCMRSCRAKFRMKASG